MNMDDRSPLGRLLEAALNTPFGLLFSDETYIRTVFRLRLGTAPNLTTPRTFNEKLQWLKLHDRNPLYTLLADKYRVREYVARRVGEERLVPLLGVWDKPEQIDFNALPDRFVLKCNHNSGKGVCVCRGKSSLDISAVRRTLRLALAENYYRKGRETPYRGIPKKILAEQYLSDEEGGNNLTDYKFLCFGGKVKCLFACTGRGTAGGLRVTFFDREWNPLPFERRYPAESPPPARPEKLSEMLAVAETLSEEIPFVRVDLYQACGKVYFGEMTFYPGNGFEAFRPESWDLVLGDYLTLPTPCNESDYCPNTRR